MTVSTDQLQQIRTLRPLSDVFNWIRESVSAADVTNVDPAAAIGATFAAPVLAINDHPPQMTALNDGWAVASEWLTDASGYAPAILARMPSWVNAGQPIPDGADAIIAVDALGKVEDRIEVYTPATAGDGILGKGADAFSNDLLCDQGERVQAIHAAILRQLNFKSVAVRYPTIKLVPLSAESAAGDHICPVIAEAIRTSGARAEIAYGTNLEQAASKPDCDAVIAVGQSGGGSNDRAVKDLTRAGVLAFHGIGLNPGQTAALGTVGDRPLLILPGRLDAALSVFLTVGAELIRSMNKAKAAEQGLALPLTKKVTSTIGLAEVVFVRRVSGGIAPLGSGVFTHQSLLGADGWILVPEASEGMSAGTNVEMRKLL